MSSSRYSANSRISGRNAPFASAPSPSSREEKKDGTNGQRRKKRSSANDRLGRAATLGRDETGATSRTAPPPVGLFATTAKRPPRRMSWRKKADPSAPAAAATAGGGGDAFHHPGTEEEGKCGQDCICLRPKTLIICKVCGHEEEDLRARKSCTAHPRTWYLQDLETCAECGANCLKMQEYSKMDWE